MKQRQKAVECLAGGPWLVESRGLRRGAARRNRGLAAMQERHSSARAWSTKQRSPRDPIAAGDGGKTEREALSQGVSRRFTRSELSRPKWQRHLATMEHVPNGREERKTARDGTQVPMKKAARVGTPGPVNKTQCQQAQAEMCIVRAMEKVAAENPM